MPTGPTLGCAATAPKPNLKIDRGRGAALTRLAALGTRGVYGNPLLPDFIVFLNWKELPWFWWEFDHFAYAAAMVVLASVSALGLGITGSKLGRVLRALRDAESRVRFLGYSVTNAKLLVFTVSAVLAGIAGALYVPQVGIINPGEFPPGNSIEVAIWVSVGGRGTLLGAILVNLAKT